MTEKYLGKEAPMIPKNKLSPSKKQESAVPAVAV